MDNGLFGRLEQELQAREKAAGLSMADILDLPDTLRSLINWILRQNLVSLHDVMVQLGQNEATARATITELVDKGFVRAIEVRGETNYKVRMASQAERNAPSNLWQALDEKLGSEE
jgi:Fic family protein